MEESRPAEAHSEAYILRNTQGQQWLPSGSKEGDGKPDPRSTCCMTPACVGPCEVQFLFKVMSEATAESSWKSVVICRVAAS
jgi:hypothetical protein